MWKEDFVIRTQTPAVIHLRREVEQRSGWIRIDFRTQWPDPEIEKIVSARMLTDRWM